MIRYRTLSYLNHNNMLIPGHIWACQQQIKAAIHIYDQTNHTSYSVVNMRVPLTLKQVCQEIEIHKQLLNQSIDATINGLMHEVTAEDVGTLFIKLIMSRRTWFSPTTQGQNWDNSTIIPGLELQEQALRQVQQVSSSSLLVWGQAQEQGQRYQASLSSLSVGAATLINMTMISIETNIFSIRNGWKRSCIPLDHIEC